MCPFDKICLITYKEQQKKKTDSGEEQRDSLHPAEIKPINDRVAREIYTSQEKLNVGAVYLGVCGKCWIWEMKRVIMHLKDEQTLSLFIASSFQLDKCVLDVHVIWQ